METVFLDIETTGVDPETDEIVELALVTERGHPILATKLKPARLTQWPEAQAIHGIAPADVAWSPSLDDILPVLKDAVTNAQVVILYPDFTLGFLPASVKDAMGEVRNLASEAGQFWGPTGNERLRILASKAHYRHTQPHRAEPDAYAMRAVFTYLTDPEDRAEVERIRARGRHFTRIRQEAASALERLEREQAEAQKRKDRAAQEKSANIIHRYFLRESSCRHWTNDIPWHKANKQIQAIFSGLPLYYHADEIPAKLAGASWFPKLKWFQDELKTKAYFIGPKTVRPLFAIRQQRTIEDRHFMKLQPTPQNPTTRTELLKEGYSQAEIDTFLPACERWNALGKFWYSVYDRREIEAGIATFNQ